MSGQRLSQDVLARYDQNLYAAVNVPTIVHAVINDVVLASAVRILKSVFGTTTWSTVAMGWNHCHTCADVSHWLTSSTSEAPVLQANERSGTDIFGNSFHQQVSTCYPLRRVCGPGRPLARKGGPRDHYCWPAGALSSAVVLTMPPIEGKRAGTCLACVAAWPHGGHLDLTADGAIKWKAHRRTRR